MLFPRESIRRFLARNRRHWLINKLGSNLAYYYHGFENQDYNPQSNGERFVLERLAALKPSPLIFDVGAHYGEWAVMAAQAAPRASIHSFEVIGATYAKLAEQCKGVNQITPHHLGLSDASGMIEFSVALENDTLSSGVPGLHGEFHQFEYYRESCAVARGDEFCAQHGIGHIDLLKIDVEGLESKVISGFSKMLREKRIGAIQFEYGQINLKARFFLEDYHHLLRPFGMRLGKIYPRYVDFKDYHFTQDDLTGPNYLAVSETNPDYIAALGGNS